MKIVCFGDSLTFGYNVSHKEKWHVIAENETGIRMQNSGINGDTTDGMLARIQQVFAAKPDGVILMGGYNDIFFNRSWERAAQNMKIMVDQFRDQNLMVFVAIPPPILLPVAVKEGEEAIDFEESYVMIEAYCQWLKDFIAAYQMSALNFRDVIDWNDHKLYLDGIHQSPEGHQRMADKLIEFLKKQISL
ncbi:MAG: GDSL-type esterase/lipase family protein [Acetobacterium sp.]